jgi:hypothetical protein
MTLFSACPLQVRSLVAFHGEQDICELLRGVLALPVALRLADQLDPTHRVGASLSDAVLRQAADQGDRDDAHQTLGTTGWGSNAMVHLLARVVGVGVETADMLVQEVFSRNLRDRKAVARYAGLTGPRTRAARNDASEDSPKQAMRVCAGE